MYIQERVCNIIKWTLITLLFVLFSCFYVTKAFAEGSDNHTKAYLLNEDVILYENSEAIATLQKGNIFFMSKNEQSNSYTIQFGNHLLETLPGLQTSIVEDDNTSINMLSLKENTKLISFNEGASVYSVVDPELEVARIAAGQSYPIYEELEDVYQLVIGNRLVQVNKDSVSEINDSEKGKTDDQENDSLPNTNLPQKTISASTPKFTKFFKAVGENVPIYVNRAGKTEHVGNLVSGQEYLIVGQIEGFLRIDFGGKPAYVRTSAEITPSNGSTIKNLNSNLVSKGRSIQAKRSKVTIYDNTSGSLVPFAEINTDETLLTVRQTSSDWLQVLFGGRIGYIYKPQVIVQLTNSDTFFQPYYYNTPIHINQAGKTLKVGDLRSEQEYRVFGQIEGFVRIQYGNGYAYVRTSYISASDGKSIKNHSSQPFSNNGRTVRAKWGIPVYDNTSGSLVEFGRIDVDQEYTTVRETSTYWMEVNFAGRIGYIYKPHAQVEFKNNDAFFRPLGENVNILRNEQGRNVVVGQLANEQEFRILSHIEGFVRIQYGGSFAYIRTDSIYPSNGATITNINSGVSSSNKTFRTARVVPIYVSTSGSSGEVAWLEQGESYTILGDHSANWFVVSIGGRIGYVYKPWVEFGPIFKQTLYGLTLQEMLNIQMGRSPKTDRSMGFVSARYIDQNNRVSADVLYLRSGPSTSHSSLGQVNKGVRLEILGTHYSNDNENPVWYEVRYTHAERIANAYDTAYYLNPDNFNQDSPEYFQFLVLSESAGIDAGEVNSKILAGKGILSGKAASFIEASRKYGVNEIYLIAHALHETGNGGSTLANGVLHNGRKVYNMYGIGAVDSCPVTCGAERAYNEGWFTPEAAIIGGAQFISSNYIHNTTFKQDTLYKMRWNPVHWRQYATDIGWAVKQVYRMRQLYDLLDTYTLIYDIPVYN